jgi:hypothetical protein
MPQHSVPLNELAVAVENAVQQVLGKHGAVPIDKLWFGFVAPENLANLDAASKVATQLGKEAGVRVQASVAEIAPAAQQSTVELVKPGHIIGLVYAPRLPK